MFHLPRYSRRTNCSNPATMSCRQPPIPSNFNIVVPYLCSFSQGLIYFIHSKQEPSQKKKHCNWGCGSSWITRVWTIPPFAVSYVIIMCVCVIYGCDMVVIWALFWSYDLFFICLMCLGKPSLLVVSEYLLVKDDQSRIALSKPPLSIAQESPEKPQMPQLALCSWLKRATKRGCESLWSGLGWLVWIDFTSMYRTRRWRKFQR